MNALPIDKIQIGTRHRREMGDVAALASSMGELGLLQPVVVRPDGILIAGERRLRGRIRPTVQDACLTGSKRRTRMRRQRRGRQRKTGVDSVS
jgi:hypothetical protein